MNSMIFFALLVAFSFVVEALLLTLATKLLHFKHASVKKAVQAVLYGWVLMALISVPLLFVFEMGSSSFEVGFFVVALLAGTLVVRNLYQTKWSKALMASVFVACLWGLITSLLGVIG